MLRADPGADHVLVVQQEVMVVAIGGLCLLAFLQESLDESFAVF